MIGNRIYLRPWRDEDAPLLYRYASDPDVGPRAGWAPHQSIEESLHIIQTVFRNPTTWAIILKGNTTIPTNTSLPIEGNTGDAGVSPAVKADAKEVRSTGRTNGCPGASRPIGAFNEAHSEVLSQSIGSRTNEDSDLLIGAIGYGPSCDCNLSAREDEPTVGYWIAKPFWNQGLCTEALQLMVAHIRQTTSIPSLISGHFTDNPASGRVMEKCGFVPTGDICYDPTLHNAPARPNLSRLVGIRVLRLTL